MSCSKYESFVSFFSFFSCLLPLYFCPLLHPLSLISLSPVWVLSPTLTYFPPSPWPMDVGAMGTLVPCQPQHQATCCTLFPSQLSRAACAAPQGDIPSGNKSFFLLPAAWPSLAPGTAFGCCGLHAALSCSVHQTSLCTYPAQLSHVG